MKKMLRKTVAFAYLSLMTCALLNCAPDNEEKPTPVPDPESEAFFAKGADISWITEMEGKGYKFYDGNGQEKECTSLMKELGFNAVRYRVWVNPSPSYNSMKDVLNKALRAKALEMKIMIDFHYSDSWADPGKQTVPAAWKEMSPDEMAEAVANHTKETLQLLKDNGIDVMWVQVGNEVTNGMLWETGRVSGSNIGSFGKYFDAGYNAVKSIYPDAQVVLHIDNGWKSATVQWFFNLMKANGVKYDVAGFSLYPSYWDDSIKGYPDWSEKVRQFISQVKTFKALYGKPVLLTEFGMPASEPEKAKEALQYLLDNTSSIDFFGGIFLWEPESEQSRNGYAYGAFSNGRPTSALDPFKN